MSVVGVDLGDYKSVVAVARNRGIDIVVNEVSNRFTPSMVGFTAEQRLLGESAKTQEIMNFKNTISSMKRLLGRDLNEADIQDAEKKYALYDLCADEKGETAARINYQGEQKVFTMVQLSAMFLSQIKKIAEAALKTPVSDIVLSVPAYYTDRQRHALTNAAEIAGLNTLRLFNEPAAAALVYGITRAQDLPEKDPRHVVFVDVGHSAMSVSVVAFTKEKAVVKATAFDRHLGGRNFDEDLVQHFAKEIQAKHKFDVFSRPKALLRLRVACEKLKKVLSANSKGVLNVESLTDEIDVHSQLDRDQFDEMIKFSIERLEAPLRIALHLADIRKDQVDFVELIGGSSRIPAIRNKITQFFGNREGLLSTTLNFDEAVARGCAFQCAMISPLFKVRDYSLKDATPYDIKVKWDSTSEALVFKQADGVPSTKGLTFFRSANFDFSSYYSDPTQLAPGTKTNIAKFLVKNVVPTKEGKPSEIKVKVRMNPSGIFAVESASVIEEIEDEATGADKMDATPARSEGADKEEPAAAKETVSETEAAAAATNGTTEEKKEEKKRKVKKTDLVVEVLETWSLPSKVIAALREQENAMAAHDKLVSDTLEKKNALEEYVYDMRGKIEGEHGKFLDENIKADFKHQLQETEDWLYNDGQNAPKSTYVERLEALKKIGGPMVERFNEAETRPKAINDMRVTINQLISTCQSTDDKFDHIDASEKQKVLDKCDEKDRWLQQNVRKQEALKPWENPVLRTSAIYAEREGLVTFCSPILNKPKPKPKTEEPPAAATPPPKSETPSPEKADGKASADGPQELDLNGTANMDVD